MFGRHVQRVEAMPVVFGLGTFDDGEPHAREDRLELVAHDGERMPMSERRHAPRQRDVDGSRRPGSGFGALRVGLPARFNRLFQLVRVAPDVLLLVGGRRANRLHPGGDHAVLASQVAVADRLRIADGLRVGELALELRDVVDDGGFAGLRVRHGSGLAAGS
jgi:hypothetical protein